MARLMFSAGMFSALAARIAVRSRGLPSGSPPPCLAAMLISLMQRVKIFPRLASSAPFLCLIVAHFECPDIRSSGAQGLLNGRPFRGAQLLKISDLHRTLIVQAAPQIPGRHRTV